MENPIIIEGSDDGNNLVLRLRSICEGNPKTRLQRLLKRRKFNEAETFAKINRLNFEDIYLAKASWILERLSPFLDRQNDEASLEDLNEVIGKITSPKAIVDLCNNAVLSTITDMKSLIKIGSERVRNFTDDVEILVPLNLTIQRINTFSLLQNYGQNCDVIDKWLAFKHADLVALFKTLLCQQRFEESMIIWLRHPAEFKALLCRDFVENLMSSVQLNPSKWNEFKSQATEWMKQFFSDVLRKSGECFAVLKDWVIMTLYRWENAGQNRIPWSIEFAKIGLEILTRERTFNTNLSKLESIIEGLEDLQQLHSKSLRFRVDLDDYIQEDKVKVGSMLVDWCSSTEDLKILHSQFLPDFCAKHAIKIDLILHGFALSTVASDFGTWYSLDDGVVASWQDMIEAIVPMMNQSPDLQIEVILAALQSAPVPWSPVIDNLSQSGLKLTQKLPSANQKIVEQTKLAKLKTILKKFNCKSLHVSGREARRVIQRIVKLGGNLEEIQIVAELLPNPVPKSDTFYLYIQSCLSKDELDTAIDAFKQLNVDEQGEVSGQLFSQCQSKIFMEEINQSFVDFLQMSSNEDLEVLKLKNVVKFKQKFGAVFNDNCREQVFKLVVDGMLEDSLEKVLSNIGEMTNLMDMEMAQGLEIVVECLAESRKFSDLATTLSLLVELKYCCNMNVIFQTVFSALSEPFDSVDDIGRLLSSLHELCKLALLCGHQNRLEFHAQICKMAEILAEIWREFQTGFKDRDFAFDTWRLTPLFKDEAVPLSDVTVFNIYSKIVLSVINNISELPYFSRSMRGPEKDQISSPGSDVMDQPTDLKFEEMANALVEQSLTVVNRVLDPSNQNLIALKVLRVCKVFVEPLLSQTHDGLRDSISNQIHKLFVKILSLKKPDLQLALALISTEPERRAMNMLKKTNDSFSIPERKIVLANVGLRYCAHIKSPRHYSTFKQLLLSSIWTKKCVKLGINSKPVFPSNSDLEKKQLLHLLIENKLSFLDVVRYSQAFDLIPLEVTKLYIKVRLTSVPFEVKNDQVSIQIEDNFWSDVHQSFYCSSTAFMTILQELFEIISPYNYEVLIKVLEKWGEMVEQEMRFGNEGDEEELKASIKFIIRAKLMSKFLLNHRRIRRPDKDEVDWWLQAFPSTTFPEEIAKLRIPLRPLIELNGKDAFNHVLKDEFQLSNLDEWLKSASMEKFVFKQSPDSICVQAAQNAVQELLEESVISPSQWRSTLEEIQGCLSHISMKNMAVAAAHWIINRLPNELISEKLFCAKMCREFAENWHSESENATSLQGLQFATATETQINVEQILRRHGLFATNCPLHDALQQNNWEELIDILYHQRLTATINRAVDEIAQICCSLNLQVLKYQLLDKWLRGHQETSNHLDETITNFCLNSKQPGSSSDEENLARAVYVLKGFQNQDGIDYLIQIAMANEDNPRLDETLSIQNFNQLDNVTTEHKVRALKCLLSVCEPQDFDRMGCHGLAEKIDERLQVLSFVSRLEKMSMALDISAFESYEKTTLIEAVLRSRSNTKEGIVIAIDLCKTYNTYKSEIWNVILKKLTALQLWSELEYCLLDLNSQPSLWNLESYSGAWNALIERTFKSVSTPVAEEQKNECERIIKLTSCCSVPENLEKIRIYCEKLQLSELFDQHLGVI